VIGADLQRLSTTATSIASGSSIDREVRCFLIIRNGKIDFTASKILMTFAPELCHFAYAALRAALIAQTSNVE